MAFMEEAGSPGDMRPEKRIRLRHAIITDSLRNRLQYSRGSFLREGSCRDCWGKDPVGSGTT